MSFLDTLYNRSMLNGCQLPDPCDEEWRKSFPSIHEFVTVSLFNGKERQPGKLQITSDLGKFKISIIDNACKAMLSVESDTIVLGLTALEHKASQIDAEWHRWGKPGGTRKRARTDTGTQNGD